MTREDFRVLQNNRTLDCVVQQRYFSFFTNKEKWETFKVGDIGGYSSSDRLFTIEQAKKFIENMIEYYNRKPDEWIKV